MPSTYELIVKAVDQTSGPLGRIDRNLKNLQRTAKNTTGSFNSISGPGAAAGFGVVGGAISRLAGPLLAVGAAAGTASLAMNAIIDATKTIQQAENSLRLFTNSNEELASVMARVQGIALETRTSFAATADLFTKLSVASGELGVTQDEVVQVTTKLAKALQVAGADGNTASSVIRQFGQAMASGTVRGDEFISINEGLGQALAIMGKESGITIGQLREMSQAGELTAKVFFDMIKNSTALDEAFGKMNPTIDSVEQKTADAFDRMLVKIGEVSGATSAYTSIVENLGRSFDYVAGTESAPVNKTVDQLRNFEENGLTAAQALKELQGRLEDLPGSLEQAIKAIDEDFFSDIFGAQTRNEELLAAFRHVKKAIEEQTTVTKKAADAGNVLAKAFQPMMDNVDKVLKDFEGMGKLTGIDKLKADLVNLQVAQENYMQASNMGAKSTYEGVEALKIFGRAIEATEAQIKKYNEAQAETAKRAEELAERQKRANDPLYDQTKAYDELFARYVKVTGAQYELLDAIGKGNEGTAKQQAIMKALSDEATSLAEKLGLVTQHFGNLTAMGAVDELAKIDKQLKEAGATLTAWQALDPKMTSLDANQIAAGTTALEETVEALTKTRNALLGIEEPKKTFEELFTELQKNVTETSELQTQNQRLYQAYLQLNPTVKEQEIAQRLLGIELDKNKKKVKETESAYSKFLKPLQEAVLAQDVMANNFNKLTSDFGGKGGRALEVYRAGLEKLASQGYHPAAQAIDELNMKTFDLANTIQTHMKAASDSLAKDLARGLAQGKMGLDDFRDYFNRFLEDLAAAIIQQRITQPLINDIISLIPGSTAPNTAGGSNMVSDAWNWITGLFRAGGGPVAAGKGYVVGERGPEMFVPSTAGTIVSNQEMESGGDGTTVNFNINAVDTQTGVEFLLKNKPQIISMVTQAQNQRGRQGITA